MYWSIKINKPVLFEKKKKELRRRNTEDGCNLHFPPSRIRLHHMPLRRCGVMNILSNLYAMIRRLSRCHFTILLVLMSLGTMERFPKAHAQQPYFRPVLGTLHSSVCMCVTPYSHISCSAVVIRKHPLISEQACLHVLRRLRLRLWPILVQHRFHSTTAHLYPAY